MENANAAAGCFLLAWVLTLTLTVIFWASNKARGEELVKKNKDLETVGNGNRYLRTQLSLQEQRASNTIKTLTKDRDTWRETGIRNANLIGTLTIERDTAIRRNKDMKDIIQAARGHMDAARTAMRGE